MQFRKTEKRPCCSPLRILLPPCERRKKEEKRSTCTALLWGLRRGSTTLVRTSYSLPSMLLLLRKFERTLAAIPPPSSSFFPAPRPLSFPPSELANTAMAAPSPPRPIDPIHQIPRHAFPVLTEPFLVDQNYEYVKELGQGASASLLPPSLPPPPSIRRSRE
jgi:hypothetical protein